MPVIKSTVTHSSEVQYYPAFNSLNLMNIRVYIFVIILLLQITPNRRLKWTHGGAPSIEQIGKLQCSTLCITQQDVCLMDIIHTPFYTLSRSNRNRGDNLGDKHSANLRQCTGHCALPREAGMFAKGGVLTC